MNYTLTFFLAVVLPASVAAEEIPPEDWRIDRKEMTEPLEPSTRVHVINPYGDIRVRSHHKPEVYVLVHAQRHKDDPLKFELDFCESEETLQIKAFVAPHDDSVPETFRKRRMDMTVFLPRTNDAHLETSHGFAEARGMAGELRIVSEWGNVRTRHAGPVAINTSYGSVEAVLLDTRWSQDSQIETLTGAIEVRVANNATLEVAMQTGGQLTTDYTLEVDLDEKTSFKNASSRLGEGGRSLFLKSSTGNISLFRFEVEQPND